MMLLTLRMDGSETSYRLWYLVVLAAHIFKYVATVEGKKIDMFASSVVKLIGLVGLLFKVQ